jgi:hypothetical protein
LRHALDQYSDRLRRPIECEDCKRVETVTYRDLLKGLELVDAWLCERGLKQQTDRIRTNKRDIEILADAFDEGRLEKVIEEAGDDRRRELMWSLAESTEFVDSIDVLRKQGCEIPDKVLKDALDGPADLQSESEKSSRGRNTMFEIAIAGRLARAGLRPTLGQEPDVHTEFHDRKIFIQCKRVFSENGISKRLVEAGKQLKRDLVHSCDPRDCGIIAISISRAFNKGDKLLVAHDEDALRRKLNDEIDAIMRVAVEDYRHVTEPKIAGVLYHLSTPAFLEGVRMYMGAHSVTVATIPGRSDKTLLESVAKDLVTR